MSTKSLMKIIVPALAVILLITCIIVEKYNPPYGTLNCKIKGLPTNLSADYNYNVEFSLWQVDTVETTETITSDDEDVLIEYQKELLEESSKHALEGYYESQITLSENSLTAIIKIDYKQMAKETKTKKQGINKLKNNYLKIGAKCTYK